MRCPTCSNELAISLQDGFTYCRHCAVITQPKSKDEKAIDAHFDVSNDAVFTPGNAREIVAEIKKQRGEYAEEVDATEI